MKRHILISLFIFFIIFSSRALAQDTLGMGTVSSLSGSNQIGGNDSCSFYFINHGSDTIGGTISYHLAIDSGSGPQIIVSDTVNAFSLQSGDSIQASTNFTFTPAACKIGTNIVVIWPSRANTVTLDSSFSIVSVTGPNSVIELEANKKLIVYPNPSTDFIKLRSESISSANYIRRVRLFDVSGKLVDEFVGANTTFITMEKYPSGPYFLVADYSDNTTIKHQIIKK